MKLSARAEIKNLLLLVFVDFLIPLLAYMATLAAILTIVYRVTE